MEENTLYSYKLRKGDCTLQRIRDIQNVEILSLSSNEIDNLHITLEHGTDIISTEIQMCMYMYAYGKMHIAKIYDALEHIDKRIFKYKDLAIIDYGCGQGIGTLALVEYLKSNGFKIENIKSVTLIEPSKVCLDRAELHISLALPQTQIRTINKKINDIYLDEIQNEHYYTIHIFSNILDVDDIDICYLAELIKRNRFLFEEFICVGPCFTDYEKQRRYDQFGKLLDLKPHYRQDYEKGCWKENWTYSVRLYSSVSKIIHYQSSFTNEFDVMYNEFAKEGIFSETCWYWHCENIKDTKDLQHKQEKICDKSIAKESMDCYKQAANNGIYETLNNLGVYVLQKNEDSYMTNISVQNEALNLFWKAAEHGCENAILNLLYLYNRIHPEKLNCLLHKFQKQNSISAYFTAAIAFQFGRLGYEEDCCLAQLLYEKAISIFKEQESLHTTNGKWNYNDMIASFYNLAQIHYKHYQYEEAYKLIKECCDHTTNYAIYHFKYILEAKLYGRPIIHKLLKLYQPNIQHSYIIAYNIAVCYKNGIGVQKNLSLAEEYVRKICKDTDTNNSYPKAITIMALIKYERGYKSEAVELWESAKVIDPESECAFSLNQEIANNGIISYEVANKYLHKGCQHCHEALNYDENAHICPRCEFAIAIRLIEQNNRNNALEYLLNASYQGYIPAQKKILEDTEYWNIVCKRKDINNITLIDWARNACTERSIDAIDSVIYMRTAILHIQNNQIKWGLYWAAAAASSMDQTAVTYILKLYAMGIFTMNTRDFTFWGHILAHQRKESIYKVLGDAYKGALKFATADRIYKLETTNRQ